MFIFMDFKNSKIQRIIVKMHLAFRKAFGIIKDIKRKAQSTEHRPKFSSPSPAMVMSPYNGNILEWDVKQLNVNNQLKGRRRHL
jgi:hypothetical protein